MIDPVNGPTIVPKLNAAHEATPININKR